MWSTRAGCALSPKPAATRPKPTHWTPRYSPATGRCFRRRIRGNRRPTRSVKSCATCSGGGGNLLTSGSRSWGGWTRAFPPLSPSPPGATLPGWRRRSLGWRRNTRQSYRTMPLSPTAPPCTAPCPASGR